ncbi:MAG: glycoside hydrolase family 2 protein [Acetatifactor sp.]|nr:glycoside hydrolase family 2 protein [Acetatifactor sp.]
MKIALRDNWKMRVLPVEGEPGEYIPATVPGSVYGDLLAAGQMEDPFWRDNELAALKLMDNDFEYVTGFDSPETLTDCDKVLLRFDGIDTLASVYLNGELIAETNNMHRVWEIDVTKLLQPENNQLLVHFYSPTEYITKSYEEKKINAVPDAMRGAPRLRKAHCMFGWDWGARLPDAGLWREVSLVGVKKQRIHDINILQYHEDGRVRLDFAVNTDEGKAETYLVTITDPEGKAQIYTTPESVWIEQPKLWWPNGYGEQPLYTVKVELLCEEEAVDSWTRKIGLRTMTMVREKDEYGESFCHEINGVRIFAMGADYIPEDNLLGRITPERTRKLLLDAKAAHHSIIRVWGGGYYPDDFFYDICDELGIIVWQDFMFACMVYNLTEEFEETVTAEIIDNITRLRHHASLGAWCGNNEIESFIAEPGNSWISDPTEYADYIKLFEYIIPKLVKTYSPQTFYWPSSPSSGGAYDKPGDENRGDVHYWDVWHGNKPITEYRKFHFRYLSEFGFQSFPSLQTIETFTEPEDRNIFSYAMEKHQRNGAANGKIMNYMEQTYLYPTSFDMVLYASQLLQAEAMRYGVEHFRRNRGRCMGAVIWQLNDNWPVASWSSIDYFGRWKALHYYEKRFFAPLMISCQEEGTLTQDPNVNAQPYEVIKSATLNVANETLQEKQVTVEWELRDNTAAILRSGSEELTVPALTSLWLDKLDMSDADLYSNYVSYRLKEGDKVVSEGTVLFCPPKFFRFKKPDLQVKIEGDELVVSSDVFAKSIRIQNENDDMILEDNFFDLNGGEKRVKIVRGVPSNLHVSSVYDIR